MELINRLTPWFVLVMSCGIFYVVVSVTVMHPITWWDVWLVSLIGVSLTGLVIASFYINTTFDRIERRAKWLSGMRK